MPPSRSGRAVRRSKPDGRLETHPAENGAVSSLRATTNEITREEYDAQINGQMSEDTWRRQVRAYASGCGWILQYHTYRSDRSDPGFPDDVLSNGQGRLVFIESKRQRGVLMQDQVAWLDQLAAIRDHGNPSIEVYVARPSDHDDLWDMLSGLGLRTLGIPDILHQWCLIPVCQRCMTDRDNATLIIRGRGGRIVKQIRRAKARGYTT